MKFVITGGLRTDYLITQDGKAHLGLPGGNALFASAGAAMWADRQDIVAPWARYGSNFPSKWLATLQQLGLHTGALIAIPGEQDHRTFFAYTEDGQRVDTDPKSHFARIGIPLPKDLISYVHSTPQQDDPFGFEPLAIQPSDWPEGFDSATAVHLAPLPLATHLHVPAELRNRGIELIAVDPGERYMVPACLPHIKVMLRQVDVFLPSDMEIRSLFGADFPLWQAAKHLSSWGVPLVIIKIGAGGILIYDGQNDRKYHLQPFHQADDPRVIDVTGAGDAFCGGFIVGLAKTGSLLQAANMGLVAASIIIEGYGALFALKTPRSVAENRLRTLTSGQKITTIDNF